MIIVLHHLRDGPCQRLAWDPAIIGLGISFTNVGEQIFAGESHFDFPLNLVLRGACHLMVIH
jgi:hypothetical protein